MTKITTLLLLIIFPFIGYSQTDEIAQWQKTHPTVILIEVNDLTPKFEKSLIAQNQDYILYEYEVSIDQLNEFDAKTIERSSIIAEKDENGKRLIKDWMGENKYIKIVAKSNFDASSEANKIHFQEIDALILEGEKITLNDIQNYEANK